MWHFKIYGRNTFPTTIYLSPKPPAPRLFDEKPPNLTITHQFQTAVNFPETHLKEDFIIGLFPNNNKIKEQTSPSTH